MKKRYFFYGLLVLLILFIAYNYYSADEAEENITKLIKEQVDEPRANISIQYSAVDVSPFAGNIRFEDVTVVQPETIRRVGSLTLDLTYFDFLKFNFGGIEYGLKHLSDAILILNEAAYINRQTRAEVSFNRLFIDYSGDLWDAVEGYFTAIPYDQSHTLTISGSNAVYWKPQSSAGTFTADSVYMHHTFTARKTPLTDEENSVYLSDIVWSPPESFQQKYAFFIQGFGLAADSVSFDEAGFSYFSNDERIQITDGIIEMSLFTADFYGVVDKEPVTTFSPLYVEISELSPQLVRVLQNLKQLFDLPIPLNGGEIQFRLRGPVTDPEIIYNEEEELIN